MDRCGFRIVSILAMATSAPKRSPKSARERFAAELEPHLAGLWRTALRMTRNATRAEDLVQDALLKAYRFFDSYEPGTNFGAWVHRVLYTVFLNNTRGEPPRAAALDQVAEPPEAERSLLDDLGRRGAAERARVLLEAVDDRIKEAVLEMPEDLRLVFLLSTIEGLKYREIADVMDCPIGTVMSRLFRGRKFLQDKLADYASVSGFRVGSIEGEAE